MKEGKHFREGQSRDCPALTMVTTFSLYLLFCSKVKEKVFFEHPHIEHLSEKLLHVFVTIEMRGQSVDSEMKFNYRKSMHRVIQFICDIPVHRKAIRVRYIM